MPYIVVLVIPLSMPSTVAGRPRARYLHQTTRRLLFAVDTTFGSEAAVLVVLLEIHSPHISTAFVVRTWDECVATPVFMSLEVLHTDGLITALGVWDPLECLAGNACNTG
jgi:hypothetical protein